VTRTWRVAVCAADEAAAEPVRARLLALAPAGIEERSVGEGLELAIYVDDADRDAVVAVLPGARAARVEDDWPDAWRRFHRPVVVEGLWLGPPWEEPPDPARAVVIDPGRAFGTGAHPTTRLCVALLASLPARGSLLDIGCGSGVLAIAAARLGFSPVRALDVDPVAVETTRANAAANGLAVDAFVCDAELEALPRADTAVANVLLRPVERILERVDVVAAVTSGYLASDVLHAPGWRHVERRERDGWAADLLVRER
jgi:ribosomal protein L11 methyltransferase